jgi:hypothetical protein
MGGVGDVMRKNDFFTYLLFSGKSRQWDVLESESLPVTFVSDGRRLKNYRIYGKFGGVGDLDGDKYLIPVTLSGKNLYDATTYPLQGGVVVYGQNGSTANNQSFASTDFIPCESLQGQTLTLNKRPGGKNAGIAFYDSEQVYISGVINNNAEAGTPISFSVPDNAVYMRFSVPNNTDEIQLEKGSSSTAYEPYHAPQTTVIELDEPLAGGQYIDFMRDGLPPITPFDGTNILTVDTTVQPSKVYLQGSIDTVANVSLQTLQLAPQVSMLDIDDGLQLDVMPVEIPVQLNEISPTIGGDESAK